MLSVCKRCCSRLTVAISPYISRSLTSTNMPRLDVSPQVALVDEKICITASGLRPLQKVTLRTWVEELGAVYSSCGQFAADQQGCVDTGLHSSHGGTYIGTDIMGLFWSIKPVPGISKKSRILKSDVTTPFVFEVSLIDDHVNFEDLRHSALTVLATTTCERWYKHPDVRRVVVREGPLRGTVFLPSGPGPFPGVIDTFGTAGGLIELRAALLASRGFASFALAYFGYDDLPKSVEDLDLSYFLRAIDWFGSQPFVHPNGLGLVGASKGGELGFIIGMTSEKVKAIVNISGAPGLAFSDLKRDGKVYVKGVPFVESRAKHTDEGVTSHDCFPDMDNSYLPAWEKNAKILYLCGADDGLWDTKGLTATFEQKCPPEKRKNLEVIVYPDTGHLIEPPYMPLCRSSFSKYTGLKLLWGGQPKPHAAAQEDAWKRLLAFLREHLEHKNSLKSHL